jgi:hypothetical protein
MRVGRTKEQPAWSRVCAFAVPGAVLCRASSGPKRAGSHLRADREHRGEQTLTVRNRDSHAISFDLAPQGRIVSNEPLDVRDIRAGDVIAIDEEMGKPIQAHTQAFAHGANALAQRKLATNPNATRYLGVVTAAEPTANGVKAAVDLQKNSGRMQVELTDNIVHYRNEMESMAEVKPGLFVMATANRGDSDKLASGFTTIEKNFHRPIDIW